MRGDDGAVRVLYNRCRHRGNLLCNRDSGSAATLKCPYHGWTYAAPARCSRRPSRRAMVDLRREDFSLSPAPRVGSYRGLVFASASGRRARRSTSIWGR